MVVDPTTSPTRQPSSIPTISPTNTPTTIPTSFPTTTLQPTIDPTVLPPHALTSSTLSLFSDTEPLSHVDILWLVTSLLLSLLCIILVVLTYYVFKSRFKEDEYGPPSDMN